MNVQDRLAYKFRDSDESVSEKLNHIFGPKRETQTLSTTILLTLPMFVAHVHE